MRRGDWYNALQLGATKRFSNGHRWQVSYTLGKAVDETQGQTGGDATYSSVFPQNPIDPRSDRSLDYLGRSIRTMSEFSRERSNTMALPSGVMSKVPMAP
jgi:hypothetical protein